MQALVLVGGLGTRLKKVVSDRPKPMALIKGKPFLEYLINNLKTHGITEIILAVGYMGSYIESYFKSGEDFEVKIKYSYEDISMGTAGAIKNAEKLITEESFMILNGDTYFDINYKQLMHYHKQKESSFTMVLRRVEDAKRYGTVKFDNEHRITGFMEKREDKHVEGYINGGIYIVNKSILNKIPAGKKFSLENKLMPELVKNLEPIYCKNENGYFIDIGIPEDYYKFTNDIKGGLIK